MAIAVCLFTAWLFTFAAIHKVADFKRFQATLLAYKIVPAGHIYWASGCLIVLEVLAVFGLLITQIWPNLPLGLILLFYLGPILLFVYALAMSVNLARGRRSIDCGCGGVPMPLSRILVARNLVLVLTLLWVQNIQSNFSLIEVYGEFGVWGISLVLAAVVGLSFVYVILNQLLANRALHQRLWLQV